MKLLSPESTYICVDNNPDRIKQISEDGLYGCDSLQSALGLKPDVAFVCTSPGHHAEIILTLIEAGIHVFTELNLVSDRYEEIIERAKEKNTKVFMSSTMLYDKQIVSVFNTVGRTPKNLSYFYHVGQYLPDWHPWESYKDFFIGRRETNGCREILAIQLPWLVKLFGKVVNVSVVRKKNTNLEIDFDDTYFITLEHDRENTGVFVCDVVSRKAVNYLEILGEKTHIIWEGTPDSLFSFDDQDKCMRRLPSYEDTKQVEGYSDIIIEDQYLDETKAFLEMIYENKTPMYSLEDDREILELIDTIEH